MASVESLSVEEKTRRLQEQKRILKAKKDHVKKMDKELKRLIKAHDISLRAHDELKRQLEETQVKLAMVNDEYEDIQRRRKTVNQRRQPVEAERVHKVCVQITKQYLDEVKKEDELRERIGQQGALSSTDVEGEFDLDLDGKVVQVDGFDDGVDSEEEDEQAGRAAIALLEAEMKELRFEAQADRVGALPDGTDARMDPLDEKMDEADAGAGAVVFGGGTGAGAYVGDGDDDLEEKGPGPGAATAKGSVQPEDEDVTAAAAAIAAADAHKETALQQALQIQRDIREAEIWLERRQRLAVRKQKELEAKMDGTRRMMVKYLADGRTYFECMLYVDEDATFGDVLAQACAHWGLPSDQAFLEAWDDDAIWPSTSKVDDCLDVALSTPVVRLVFRLGYSIRQLVASEGDGIHLDVDDERVRQFKEARAKILDEGADGARLEKALEEDGKLHIEPRRFIERKSKMTRDLLLFVVFFILLNVSLGTRRAVSDLFYLSSTLREATVERHFEVQTKQESPVVAANGSAVLNWTTTVTTERKAFRQITTDDDVWTWLEVVLAEAVFPSANTVAAANVAATAASNSTAAPAATLPGQLVLKDNLVTGATVRVRQLMSRVNNSCEVSEEGQANKWINFCYSQWGEQTNNQQLRIPSWMSGWTAADDARIHASGGQEDPEVQGILTEAFTYNGAFDLSKLENGGTTPISGRIDSYGGGGYVYDAKTTTLEDFKKHIKLLRRGAWTDRGTRMVAVEMSLYNQNLNMYLVGQFLLELTLGGMYLPSFEFNTVRLESDFFTARSMVLSVLDMCLHVFVLYFIYVQLIDMCHACRYRGGCDAYLSNFWKIVDLIIILIYLGSVAFRALQYLQFGPYSGRIEQTAPQFTLLMYPAWLYESALQCDALVIFFSVIRLFQYAALNEHLLQFLLVFKRAAVEISFYAGIFLLAFFGFVCTAYEVFGPAMHDFATLGDTSTTLLQLMGGSPSLHALYEKMRMVDPAWAPAFFFMYICFTVLILVNIFLAILNATYTQVSRDMTVEHQRLRILESLRPSKRKTLFDFFRFFRDHVFSARKAFTSAGIYGNYEDKRHKLKEVLELAAKTSNPWANHEDDSSDEDETKAALRPGERRRRLEAKKKREKAILAAADATTHGAFA